MKIEGRPYQATPAAIDMVNAALYLRRPLLVTGKPGTGKSSLAYAVARELMLGEVLYWPITTRTTLKNGLYDYDAIGRLQDAKQLLNEAGIPQGEREPATPPSETEAASEVGTENKAEKEGTTGELTDIGSYITLGPLGTALLPSPKPRVLLIDEIDKSDIDLPNDLLTVLEEGTFKIPELERIKAKVRSVRVRTAYTEITPHLSREEAELRAQQQPEYWQVDNGRVTCTAFPFVILTSNGERAFPPPFLRRCLRLAMPVPTGAELTRIVNAHLQKDLEARRDKLKESGSEQEAEQWFQQARKEQSDLTEDFEKRLKLGDVATDQLLNAIFMVTRETPITQRKEDLLNTLLKHLNSTQDF
ncbi:MoxR family ATPase [Synechococcus sp. PCC 7336]|uniref:AAA family ATPase n=1 Tax=Synechococcus sp. PCC 7336 TaxID=195250 RepID=UPI00034C105C|nr:MoxR family ATPase [Synechococcus sp. PCC 7336]